jgi:hypothetical protein
MKPRPRIAFILSLPLLAFGIVFDIIKLPFLIPMVLLWAFLDLIAVLQGEEAILPGALPSMLLMGVSMWFETVGIPEPKWMEWP